MKELPLIEHLNELRTTVIRILVILVASFFLTFYFANDITTFLIRPLSLVLAKGEQGDIVYLGLLDQIVTQMQVAFFSGVIVSAPLWFFQCWKFIGPALYEAEKKLVRRTLLSGFVFFYAGISVTYFIVFPFLFETLLSFGIAGVRSAISLQNYVLLVLKMLVFAGFLFQLPNVLVILGYMGLVTKYSLRKMRTYVYLGMSVFAAVVTPADTITMLLVWIPLMLLYEAGILAVSLFVHPYLEKKTETTS